MGCSESKPIFPTDDRDPYGPFPYTKTILDEHWWWWSNGHPTMVIKTDEFYEPLSIPGLFQNLNDIDEKLVDLRQRLLSERDRYLDHNHPYFKAMDLDCDAKFIQLRAVQCQALCLGKLKDCCGISEKDQQATWEKYILDYEIIEIKARAVSEIIKLIMPHHINSHPVRVTANRQYESFLNGHKQWTKEARRAVWWSQQKKHMDSMLSRLRRTEKKRKKRTQLK